MTDTAPNTEDPGTWQCLLRVWIAISAVWLAFWMAMSAVFVMMAGALNPFAGEFSTFLLLVIVPPLVLLGFCAAACHGPRILAWPRQIFSRRAARHRRVNTPETMTRQDSARAGPGVADVPADLPTG